MKDKNGKEIKNGCFLRVKYPYGESKQLQDGIYRVNLNEFSGIEMRIVKILQPETTFHTTLTWHRNELREDYVNQNYDRLAVMDTMGKNHMHGNTWIEQNYSNDIEIVEFKEPTNKP